MSVTKIHKSIKLEPYSLSSSTVAKGGTTLLFFRDKGFLMLHVDTETLSLMLIGKSPDWGLEVELEPVELV